ncbi:MAG TPA: NAD(P)/FAD-dependent oxidoreductase, partial [Nitrososphaera sp.]|nr:NAD(P)/FAD-dependent oxidoreductase [Nitrososphaera sp.]
MSAAHGGERILILGGGFGGVYCAKRLERLMARHNLDFQITLVSRQNFFVFTPMLPQVISGMIESNHVVVPIRQILKNTRFYEAEVQSIDAVNKKVLIRTGSNIDDADPNTAIANGFEAGQGRSPYGSTMPDLIALEYDHLVICLGSDTNFMCMPEIEDNVFVLKNLKDALVLRNHIIDMLERADIESDGDRRRQMLNFVIVGGGLSGIETAAELNQFLHDVIKYYPSLMAEFSGTIPKIIVVQSRDRILPEVNSRLAEYASRKLRQEGISIILNSRVTDVAKDHVVILDKKENIKSTIPTETVLWTAGISPNSIIASIPCDKPSSGRLPVDSHLRVQGHQNIWAIGDCAYILDEKNGEQFPPTAQYAIREAELVANNLVASLTHEQHFRLRKFAYSRKAQMAIIGKRAAIANVGGINISGLVAWCIWRVVYLAKLPMLKKRLRIMFDWTIDLFFDSD